MQFKNHYEQYEYFYDSEEEKMKHKKEMEEKGFEDSGQIKYTIGNLFEENPEWKWYGKYFRYLNH